MKRTFKVSTVVGAAGWLEEGVSYSGPEALPSITAAAAIVQTDALEKGFEKLAKAITDATTKDAT